MSIKRSPAVWSFFATFALHVITQIELVKLLQTFQFYLVKEEREKEIAIAKKQQQQHQRLKICQSRSHFNFHKLLSGLISTIYRHIGVFAHMHTRSYININSILLAFRFHLKISTHNSTQLPSRSVFFFVAIYFVIIRSFP